MISPDTMAMFYASLTERGSSRLDFFISAKKSPDPIIALYQILECQYLLIPPRYKSPAGEEDSASLGTKKKFFVQAGLTPAGFAQWLTICVLIDPQREFTRLNRVLNTPGVVIPRKTSDGTPFPNILPRGALPEVSSVVTVAKYGAVFQGFGAGNQEIANQVARNLREAQGLEGGLQNGFGTAPGSNGEHEEEIKVLREQLEISRQQAWDQEQEVKRLRVQVGQLDTKLRELEQMELSEREIRRSQSISSVVSSVSSVSAHSRTEYPLAFPNPTIPGYPDPIPTPISRPTSTPMTTPMTTPMPTPTIEPQEPVQRKTFPLQTSHTMPILHQYSSTPGPEHLPRHNSMGPPRPVTTIGVYTSFQSQSPILNSVAEAPALDPRRFSLAVPRESLPASLCIDSRRRSGVGLPEETIHIPAKFKRNDEFSRILGTDV